MIYFTNIYIITKYMYIFIRCIYSSITIYHTVYIYYTNIQQHWIIAQRYCSSKDIVHNGCHTNHEYKRINEKSHATNRCGSCSYTCSAHVICYVCGYVWLKYGRMISTICAEDDMRWRQSFMYIWTDLSPYDLSLPWDRLYNIPDNSADSLTCRPTW